MGANHFYSGVKVQTEVKDFWIEIDKITNHVRSTFYPKSQRKLCLDFFRGQSKQSEREILDSIDKATFWLKNALKCKCSEPLGIIAFMMSDSVWSNYVFKFIQHCPDDHNACQESLTQIRSKASNVLKDSQKSDDKHTLEKFMYVYFIQKDVNYAASMLVSEKISNLRIMCKGYLGAGARPKKKAKIKDKPIPIIAKGIEVRIRPRSRT